MPYLFLLVVFFSSKNLLMLLGMFAVLLCLLQRRFSVCAGDVNDEVVEGLFTSFDSNGDGSIDESKSQDDAQLTSLNRPLT